jgi:hypothetical protein
LSFDSTAKVVTIFGNGKLIGSFSGDKPVFVVDVSALFGRAKKENVT